uniref:Uncharacterized protein MANES_02G016800 n=1 Tax=Rhizophora mucronata TaxID=61149 RepID=A0A2P2LLD7_RHIMU
MLALLTSPIASPTANLVDALFRATMGNTRTTSFSAIIELWRQVLRMTVLPGSMVCKIKLTTLSRCWAKTLGEARTTLMIVVRAIKCIGESDAVDQIWLSITVKNARISAVAKLGRRIPTKASRIEDDTAE